MIISRLVTVLIADVAALRALAGGELFQHLAHACIAAHPSVLPNARWFGLHLGLFLASAANFVSQPMLNEMAKFKWAINHPYDSADDTVVNIASWLICQATLDPHSAFKYTVPCITPNSRGTFRRFGTQCSRTRRHRHCKRYRKRLHGSLGVAG